MRYLPTFKLRKRYENGEHTGDHYLVKLEKKDLSSIIDASIDLVIKTRKENSSIDISELENALIAVDLLYE